jgi:hypothetical protein
MPNLEFMESLTFLMHNGHFQTTMLNTLQTKQRLLWPLAVSPKQQEIPTAGLNI